MTTPATEKGLFQRLKDSPPQTAAEIDPEIQRVETQIVEFEQQRELIKTQLADNWGADGQQASEDEFQRLGLRIEAARTVLGRLQTERNEAEKREIIAAAITNFAEREKLEMEDQKALTQIEKAEVRLTEAKQHRRDVVDMTMVNNSQKAQLIHRMQRLGISSEAAEQIFGQAYQAQAKQNGKKK